MALDISAEETFKSGYFYGYMAVAISVSVLNGFIGSHNGKIPFFIPLALSAGVLLPYCLGAFFVTHLVQKNNINKLNVSFPFGKNSKAQFTHVDTQMLVLTLFNSLALTLYIFFLWYIEDPYVSIIIAGTMMFSFIHQMLLASAIEDITLFYMLPLFAVTGIGMIPYACYLYAESWDGVTSSLNKLDFNGYSTHVESQ